MWPGYRALWKDSRLAGGEYGRRGRQNERPCDGGPVLVRAARADRRATRRDAAHDAHAAHAREARLSSSTARARSRSLRRAKGTKPCRPARRWRSSAAKTSWFRTIAISGSTSASASRRYEVLLSLFARDADHSAGRQFPHHYASRRSACTRSARSSPRSCRTRSAPRMRSNTASETRARRARRPSATARPAKASGTSRSTLRRSTGCRSSFSARTTSGRSRRRSRSRWPSPTSTNAPPGYGMPGVGRRRHGSDRVLRRRQGGARPRPRGRRPDPGRSQVLSLPLAHHRRRRPHLPLARRSGGSAARTTRCRASSACWSSTAILTARGAEALKRSVLAEANDATDRAEAMAYPPASDLYAQRVRATAGAALASRAQ